MDCIRVFTTLVIHHVDISYAEVCLGGGEEIIGNGGKEGKKRVNLDLLEGHGRVYSKSKCSHEHLSLPLARFTISGTYKQ